MVIRNSAVSTTYHQQIRISKEQKLLVESINQIQINRCSKDRLSAKHGNNLYKDWELMNAYVSRVLTNTSYEDMKSKYVIPRSNITSNMKKICHPLQYRNMRKL